MNKFYLCFLFCFLTELVHAFDVNVTGCSPKLSTNPKLPILSQKDAKSSKLPKLSESLSNEKTKKIVDKSPKLLTPLSNEKNKEISKKLSALPKPSDIIKKKDKKLSELPLAVNSLNTKNTKLGDC